MNASKSEPRQKGAPLLQIAGLKVDGFSDDRWHPIVKGVDLRLERGEILGLIGESGAGKSTLGLVAMGYAKPGCRITGGSVTFDGKDMLSLPEEELRLMRGSRIAYVAQSAAASFNPSHRLLDQTIETAVRHGLLGRRLAAARAVEMFGKLRLPRAAEIGFRFPHQVSGGQLQRAMTAMAMECRPDLIIFDEPTTALDVTTQVEVLASMREVVREFNTAAIYISHDLAVVAQMADRIMVLRHGIAVEEAPTRKMLAEPETEYTRSLWSVRAMSQAERPETDTHLSIEGLSSGYAKSVKVLDDVSLKVQRGRTLAIVGESGSGKSTLAQVISGMVPVWSGKMVFEGQVLPSGFRGRSRDLLRKIQMIYQSPDTALNPRHTVEEIIGRPLEFYLGLRGEERDRRVVELLDMIEMGSQFLDRLPGELSGGQKQRVCIARALAAKPSLVICDEVTSALDQLVQTEILKLLDTLQQELGITYVFITHDIATVRAIADQVVVMNGGKLVEQGSRAQVLETPQQDYTNLLLSSVPEMDPDWLTRLLAERRGGAIAAAN
ncbi:MULTISPECIES: ABC transporter ATP-binding protein [unclassified Mesorhizobium]|uniref:ABC transporter ATP-binding protein n=1 Tax=unclassified Mesorhizobium TaxID=325217 RepID=UPI00095C2B7F|nr:MULTISPECIES: ABC transporter ATP-binding protein [unclassified Mesorhizobium]MBN9254094.1 ABC transporter ATP-binding protein [Mesorhizobium sp.]OJX71130.1 MAG: ABC transporter [Mesorhizobium sp. 65-26]